MPEGRSENLLRILTKKSQRASLSSFAIPMPDSWLPLHMFINASERGRRRRKGYGHTNTHETKIRPSEGRFARMPQKRFFSPLTQWPARLISRLCISMCRLPGFPLLFPLLSEETSCRLLRPLPLWKQGGISFCDFRNSIASGATTGYADFKPVYQELIPNGNAALRFLFPRKDKIDSRPD